MARQSWIAVIVLIVLSLMAVSLVGCSHQSSPAVRLPSSPASAPPPSPTPPYAPSNVAAGEATQTSVRLQWIDNSDNEEGFRIYRDSILIGTVDANVVTYQDTGLKAATTYKYVVKAYNYVGESGASFCTVRTLNPPITVRIDRIGVYDNGEGPFRDFDGGEVYVYVIVSDGNTTEKRRFPAQEGQYLFLEDNETVDIEATIFSTDAVGDSLTIAFVGYERDGGSFEQLVYKALGAAVESQVAGGAGGLLEAFDSSLGGLIAQLLGAEDDWLGSYENTWDSDNNWGIGTYTDIACEEEDGTLGLRLWFTIERLIEPLVSTETPTPAPVTPPPPSSTEVLPTVDILEFPTKADLYQYATITIKASKPGAYSLTLFDESATGSASRVYDLGTILTDDYGVGKWHFKVDEDFELDRVRIWYKEGQRSFLLIDTVIIFR